MTDKPLVVELIEEPAATKPPAGEQQPRSGSASSSTPAWLHTLLFNVCVPVLLFTGGVAVGKAVEPPDLLVRGVLLLGSLLLLVGSLLIVKIAASRFRQAKVTRDEAMQMSEASTRVLHRVEALLERVAYDLQAAERLQCKAAERLMPSGRELDAVAANLPHPTEWYEEDFDPF